MKVLMFQPRFARLVRTTKRTTIRGTRIFPIVAGDQLSLREWTGLPYRSKQKVLLTTICTKVEKFWLQRNAWGTPVMHIGDQAYYWTNQRDEIARVDGFANFEDMLCWFESTHALPFTGVRIHW